MNLSLKEMISELKKQRGLSPNGYPGNAEILEKIRRFERTGALIVEEAQKAVVMGEDVEKLTLLDSISEVYNHAAIVAELQAELKRGARYKHSVSICMIAVDNFDTITKEYGMLTGDAVLAVIAKVFRNSYRAGDTVGRYMGSRFLVVLPRTTKAAATLIADKLREHVGNQAFNYNWQSFSATASVGIASFPEDSEQYEELIARAYEAMEHASTRGGDRVVSI